MSNRTLVQEVQRSHQMRLRLVEDRQPWLSRDQEGELISMLARFILEAAKRETEDKGEKNECQD